MKIRFVSLLAAVNLFDWLKRFVSGGETHLSPGKIVVSCYISKIGYICTHNAHAPLDVRWSLTNRQIFNKSKNEILSFLIIFSSQRILTQTAVVALEHAFIMFRSNTFFTIFLLTGKLMGSALEKGNSFVAFIYFRSKDLSLISLIFWLITGNTSAFVTPTFNMGNAQARSVNPCLNMASGESTITGVLAREILDSRGNPTVEVRYYEGCWLPLCNR